MKKTLSLILFFSFPFLGYSQETNLIKNLEIDSTIKTEALKYIEDNQELLDAFKDIMLVYLNSGEIKSFKNDSMILDSEFGDFKAVFKTFHLWENDTLIINGSFGIWGGIGFVIKISNDNAELFHMLSADEIPSYSYKESEELVYRLEVECSDTKIILSEFPNPNDEEQIIYGYVEFKSEDYYHAENPMDDEGASSREKLRNNMKLYFKSKKLEISNLDE